ncbi:hypothetical protein LOOC260_102030 [Paucilactobacillus hokkaidonensis JCM 18461]|uniref:6-phosphogluconolactonase n=2 Tax=Paucilactobacillus hokkaidonensis TaxID=1193095 RepID=A0A0A1GWL8_9LACO|nr:lactonase family protein [Paucilactobacillus hokkaidonensis]BAP84781.1 hypothetical protein LOOC260_102030 [Paucilactobacillus hokkaidonensis JCM 18461]
MEKYFLGTYTHRVSKGIYSFDFDPSNGQASNLKLVHEAVNPFYLALGSEHILYCINNNNDVTKPGGIMAIDVDNPSVVKASTYDSAISGTYIAYNDVKRLIYLANYDINELSLYHVGHNRIELQDRTHNNGVVGPKTEQQDGPHPHFINQTPDGRLPVCDLGLDRIFTYDITGKNQFELVATLVLPAGFGPRHLRFNKEKNIAYAVGELSSEVASLSYDQVTGEFKIIDINATIPASWTKHNGAAAIRISGDNRFLYISNRGYNSIAVFSIGDHLKLIQNVAAGGDFPWDINFSQTEDFVLVANQRSDNLSVFSRNAKTGTLKLVNNHFWLPEPLAIVAAEKPLK